MSSEPAFHPEILPHSLAQLFKDTLTIYPPVKPIGSWGHLPTPPLFHLPTSQKKAAGCLHGWKHFQTTPPSIHPNGWKSGLGPFHHGKTAKTEELFSTGLSTVLTYHRVTSGPSSDVPIWTVLWK